MGGGHGRDFCAIPPVQQHGGQGQTLRHGGAGPVQPEEGHVLSPDGKAGADTLVEQISRQQVVQTGYTEAGFAEGGGQGQLLHGTLRLFPAPFSKGIVLTDVIEGGGQRTLPFFLAHHGCAADDRRRVLQGHGLPAQFFVCHILTSVCLGGCPPDKYYFERKVRKI